MLRTFYLQHLERSFHSPLIKVLMGIRRIGKTTLLQQIQEQFKRVNPVNINFELLENEELTEYHRLHTFLKEKIESGSSAIFLDEIQRVDQREKAINSIHTAHPDTQIFLTGSNSSLLSNELSTYLRGRYLEYQVCPFSYKEYCEYHSTSLGFESFGEYLHEGGFPLLYHFTSTEREAQFQQMLDTIFMRDIIERYQIRDIPLLMELLLFIFQNSGNLTNPSKLAEHLKEKKILTNYNTMYQYLSYLKDVMLIDMVPLYDIQGKRHFERIKKYYPVDHSCINYTRSGFDLGAGKQLEAYVYNSAKYYGRKGYVGKIKEREIDFIFEKGKERIFVQVAYLLENKKVIEREYQSLLSIPDNHKKYVISLDPYQQESRFGIDHIQAWNREEMLVNLT